MVLVRPPGGRRPLFRVSVPLGWPSWTSRVSHGYTGRDVCAFGPAAGVLPRLRGSSPPACETPSNWALATSQAATHVQFWRPREAADPAVIAGRGPRPAVCVSTANSRSAEVARARPAELATLPAPTVLLCSPRARSQAMRACGCSVRGPLRPPVAAAAGARAAAAAAGARGVGGGAVTCAGLAASARATGGFSWDKQGCSPAGGQRGASSLRSGGGCANGGGTGRPRARVAAAAAAAGVVDAGAAFGQAAG